MKSFRTDDKDVMAEVVELLVRVEILLDRVRSGEVVPQADIVDVQKEALRLGFAKYPELFRPLAAESPSDLN